MKGKKTLSTFNKIFLWINAVLAAALLISYLAPITDPRSFWLPALFGLAYPFLLLLNILFIIYWLLNKKWLFLLPVICIAVGWNVLLNNFSFRFGNKEVTAPKPAGSIRVMTYNAHSFRKYGFRSDPLTKTEVLKLIGDQQADIMGFQEYFSTRKGKYDFTDSIKKMVNVNYSYFEHFTLNPYKNIGMAIFSRYPIVAKGIIPLSDTTSENQCLYVDVNKDGRIFRFYSVHLQSIGFDPEDYKFIDNVSKVKPDLHSTKRVGGKLISAFLKRSEQMYIIKNDSKKCPYPYIISGDFNDTPTSFSVNQMAKGLKNAFREKGSGSGRTYNGDFPNFQIDYIMVSPQFKVSTYQIIEKKLSDHYPVRSDVVLN